MSTGPATDVGQLALRIDFAETAPAVEIDVALFIDDDAGARMSQYRQRRRAKLRCKCESEQKMSFHARFDAPNRVDS